MIPAGPRFGVRVGAFIAAHEEAVRARLGESGLTADDLRCLEEEHLIRIGWLQHERLVHLLVTGLFAVILFGCYILLILSFSWLTLVLTGLVAVTLIFYVIHYFRLENSVQRWYWLHARIVEKKKDL